MDDLLVALAVAISLLAVIAVTAVIRANSGHPLTAIDWVSYLAVAGAGAVTGSALAQGFPLSPTVGVAAALLGFAGMHIYLLHRAGPQSSGSGVMAIGLVIAAVLVVIFIR